MEESMRNAHPEPYSVSPETYNVIHTSTPPPAATTRATTPVHTLIRPPAASSRPTAPVHTSTHPLAATTRPTAPTTLSRGGDPLPATGDRWSRQFRDRNLSMPEQRARAASLFVKLQILVYAVIILGISIVVLRIIT